jgi:GPH family glycoside/pentoside/hexuronide:cation symporter
MTPDYHERTSVFSFKNAVQKIPELAIFYSAAFTTLRFFNDPKTGKPNILLGAQVYCTLLGVLMVAAGLVVFTFVRERYYGSLVQRQERVSIKETLWQVLQCRPYRVQLAMVLSQSIGLSMVGALGYYDTVYYVCKGDLATATQWNFWMGVSSMLCGLVGIPVFAFIARRFGKRRGMKSVLLIAILAFVGSWWFYDPEAKWRQIFTGLIGFTNAGFWMLYFSIGADVVDFDELESGKRREGAFAACASWIMKVGLAVGIGASGLVLSLTGFDVKLEGAQTEHALLMIRLFFAGIPIIGLVCALLALQFFPLTEERMADIRQQLEARRGRV